MSDELYMAVEEHREKRRASALANLASATVMCEDAIKYYQDLIKQIRGTDPTDDAAVKAVYAKARDGHL